MLKSITKYEFVDYMQSQNSKQPEQLKLLTRLKFRTENVVNVI